MKFMHQDVKMMSSQLDHPRFVAGMQEQELGSVAPCIATLHLGVATSPSLRALTTCGRTWQEKWLQSQPICSGEIVETVTNQIVRVVM